MATKVSTHSTGSWFPTGYYGHYRSKTRTDFVNEYRQLAKPQPPRRFIHRSSQPVVSHLFSTHDNRNSFMCDASYFAQGLGKKRHPERSGAFDPNFIAWHTYHTETRKKRPMTSTYRQDFRQESPSIQLLTQRPKTSFEGVASTMYRTVHGPDSPNRELINAMNNEALMLTAVQRQQQAKLKKSERRETVASCLSWHRPRVPESTATSCFNHIDMRPVTRHDLAPHPPAAPQHHRPQVTVELCPPAAPEPQPCPPPQPSGCSASQPAPAE